MSRVASIENNYGVIYEMHLSAVLPRYLQLLLHSGSVQTAVSSHRAESRSDLDNFINEALSEWHAAGIAVATTDGNETWARVIICTFFKVS